MELTGINRNNLNKHTMQQLLVILLLISIIVNTILAQSDGKECVITNEKSCSFVPNVNKYTKEANERYSTYIAQFKKAEESHVPCDEAKCNCYSSVIAQDLQAFAKGITKESIDAINTKGSKYQIVENRLYREKECMFPARCSGIEHELLHLLPNLPDTEFVVNTRDWPQIHKKYGPFGPVFSFSKTKDYHDIMYPTWSFWEGGPAIELYPRGIGRWDKHRRELGTHANETAWEDKIEKAFFRGSRTSPERDPLILLSRDKPDLVDAKYTKNQAWKSDADTLNAPPAAEVSFKEHCKYKYLFNFRGVAASFRFKHILLCKSLVFHVGDEWQEFFYAGLKPWIHYIPVPANASKKDLQDLIEFAKSRDDISREIAENGFRMIWNNLKMSDVSCYWKKLIKKYTSLLDFQVTLDRKLIEINN